MTLAALTARLVGLSLGIAGGPTGTIFYSSGARIPDGEGPFISLRIGPGLTPWGTHNDGLTAIRRPSVQVVVRGDVYPTVTSTAAAVYAALSFVNETVSGVFFLKCTPRDSEPVDIGLDANGRTCLAWNLEVERRE